MDPLERPCLKEKHSLVDYIYWTLVLAVPLITAAMAMYRKSLIWLIVYLLVAAGIVLLVMRVFCSHCPHYITGTKTLRCMFFWGFPKVFKERPGPLKLWEKGVTVAGAVVLLLLPAPGLLAEPALLTVYILSLVVFLLSVRRYECGRCTYAECPSNRVPQEERPPA